jgi:hypothetical protein
MTASLSHMTHPTPSSLTPPTTITCNMTTMHIYWGSTSHLHLKLTNMTCRDTPQPNRCPMSHLGGWELPHSTQNRWKNIFPFMFSLYLLNQWWPPYHTTHNPPPTSLMPTSSISPPANAYLPHLMMMATPWHHLTLCPTPSLPTISDDYSHLSLPWQQPHLNPPMISSGPAPHPTVIYLDLVRRPW